MVRTIREQLHLEPSGRPAKSTPSLVEKLHRESIRLSQVQDIAGCRVVVADVAAQDQAVASLRTAFPVASVVDRRATPSYGYRAVHVVVQMTGKFVEIQVRTSLQHVWAEFSEKLSDSVDPGIKYGGGTSDLRDMLTSSSVTIRELEQVEGMLADLERRLIALVRTEDEGTRALLLIQQEVIRTKFTGVKMLLVEKFNTMISSLEDAKDQKR